MGAVAETLCERASLARCALKRRHLQYVHPESMRFSRACGSHIRSSYVQNSSKTCLRQDSSVMSSQRAMHATTCTRLCVEYPLANSKVHIVFLPLQL